MLNERLAELELAEGEVDSVLVLVAKAREERDWLALEGPRRGPRHGHVGRRGGADCNRDGGRCPPLCRLTYRS
jgi:hypothetical protein